MNYFEIAAIVGLAILLFAPMGFGSILIINNGSSDTNMSFLDLNDTPNTYVGQANKFVQVNAGETGLQFTTASAAGDTNCSTSSDCNNMYIQKNPLATQKITGFDLNITTNSTTIPTTTLDNEFIGDSKNLAFRSAGCEMASMGRTNTFFFGFLAYASCAPLGVFTGYDVANFTVVGPATQPTVITDADGLTINATTTVAAALNVTGNVDFDLNLSIDGNMHLHGARAIFDGNVNCLDCNVSKNLNTGTLAVRESVKTGLSPDTNFAYDLGDEKRYWGQTFTEEHYLDKNFFWRQPAQTAVALVQVVWDSGDGQAKLRLSDQSLKTNITNIDFNTECLFNLQPRSFDSLIDGGQHTFGFVAQEVQLAGCGELTFIGPNGKMGVFYDSIGVLAVAEMKKERAKRMQLEVQTGIIKTFICSQAQTNPAALQACNALNQITLPIP